MSRRYTILCVLGFAAASAYLLSGCGSRAPQEPVAEVEEAPAAHQHRRHATGIQPLGDYHARIAVEKGGTLKLFILGTNETKVAHIEEQDIKGTVLGQGETEGRPIVLKADRQEGDPAGRTSQFTAELPPELRGKSFEADLLIRIAGEAYRPKFTNAAPQHAAAHGMPADASIERQREMFLTPGGLYTAADVEANGRAIPAEKFKGIEFHPFVEEEPELKPGDKVCPVTRNRADPKCSWIVGGKRYEFCCPPCLNTFLGWAKKQPERVKPPEAYVHKE
jgi:hypothetical protein